MAVVIEKPRPTLPASHKPPGGIAYRVRNGDNWVSIASRLQMDPRSLIFFNFGTSEPKYVNYYLKHNVGCTTVSPDGKNYSFWNASPGIIYLPSSASNFHYMTEPLVVTETFRVLPSNAVRAVLEQHPTKQDKMRCWGPYEVAIKFSRSLPDVTRYVYRQFIRGRVRVRSNARNIWVHEPDAIKVPAHRPGTPHTTSTLVPISPTVWMEDGVVENGVVKRYGYREAPPSLGPRPGVNEEVVDMYSPAVMTPPATPGGIWQTGDSYRCTDAAGVKEIEKFFIYRGTRHWIDGISVELEFRGEVWEWWNMRKVRLAALQEWTVSGHYVITQRIPVLRFREIARPA